jgi:DNA-binding NarL/FixJ family response regulator
VRRAKYTILLADDHAILLESLSALLATAHHVVGTVTDGRLLVEAAARLQPDVVVSDIAMPGLNGLDAAVHLRQRLPRARLIFLTMNEDVDTALAALRVGAVGYVVKSSAGAELFEAIEEAMNGRVYVSPAITTDPIGVFLTRAGASRRTPLSLRQREVLQLLADGRSMKQAAAVLGITPRTVAFHKYSIMEQLGVKTTAELLQHAVTRELVGRPPATG